MKLGGFALNNRKTSAYIPRNELYFESNRKISAYFTQDREDRGSVLVVFSQIKDHENRPYGFFVLYFRKFV
jgi:hypothetical protein